MAKGVEEIKSHIKNLIRWGKNESQIKQACISYFKDTAEDILHDIVDDVIEEYPNYSLIQKVMRSKIVCDASGEENSIILIDEERKKIDRYDRSRLKEILHPKFDFISKMYTAKFEYRPLDPGMLIKDECDNTFIYNTYKPPFWQYDWFYSKGKVLPKKNKQIPSTYRNFLWNLLDQDEKSYEYVVKWLANAVQDRNYCMLCTIGKQGIGKGVLGSIMAKIFGENEGNFCQVKSDIFKGTFNSQLQNKRLVYLDELNIKNREEEDRLKMVINDIIEVEKKGIDAKQVKNYASYYISNNHLDSLKLTADDRRFSIVNLTNRKLIDYMTVNQIEELLADDNIKELVSYLWHYPVNKQEMLKVFVSERTELIKESGLKEWQEWFLFEYCMDNRGKVLDFKKDIKPSVQDEFGINIGRPKLQELHSMYPQYFELKNAKEKGVRTWQIVVPEEIEHEI